MVCRVVRGRRAPPARGKRGWGHPRAGKEKAARAKEIARAGRREGTGRRRSRQRRMTGRDGGGSRPPARPMGAVATPPPLRQRSEGGCKIVERGGRHPPLERKPRGGATAPAQNAAPRNRHQAHPPGSTIMKGGGCALSPPTTSPGGEPPVPPAGGAGLPPLALARLLPPARRGGTTLHTTAVGALTAARRASRGTAPKRRTVCLGLA